jgi:hypothetical protein
METPKVSFEEACIVSASLMRTVTKAVEEGRLAELLEDNRKTLASLGWTTETLCNEARERMHERIRKLSEVG